MSRSCLINGRCGVCCLIRSSKTITIDKESQSERKIHISNLDEFLAESFVDAKEKPMKFAICKEETQGYISAVLLPDQEDMEENSIDFELSPCECIDFNDMEVSDFIGKPVFTSSAYEFFDFMFMFFSSLEFLVDFTEDAWKIKILKTGALFRVALPHPQCG